LSLLKAAPHGILYNEHFEGGGPTIFRHACELGCEGNVSNRADSPYRSGRTRNLIKTKSPAAIEAQRVRSENWVPSGMRLEFGGAICGHMRLSFQAARSIG
jgi:ATP-dependent DNA ligase